MVGLALEEVVAEEEEEDRGYPMPPSPLALLKPSPPGEDTAATRAVVALAFSRAASAALAVA